MMQEEEKEAAWEDHQMCSNKMKQFSALLCAVCGSESVVLKCKLDVTDERNFPS